MDKITQLQKDLQYAECVGRLDGWRHMGIPASMEIMQWLEQDLDRAKIYRQRLADDHEAVLRELHQLFVGGETNVYAFNDIMCKSFATYRCPENIEARRQEIRAEIEKATESLAYLQQELQGLDNG